MKPTITTRRMSFGSTTLTKNGTDQFVLDSAGHHMTTFPTNVKVFLLDYGNQLRDNGLLGPRSVVLLIRRTLTMKVTQNWDLGSKMMEQEWE